MPRYNERVNPKYRLGTLTNITNNAGEGGAYVDLLFEYRGEYEAIRVTENLYRSVSPALGTPMAYDVTQTPASWLRSLEFLERRASDAAAPHVQRPHVPASTEVELPALVLQHIRELEEKTERAGVKLSRYDQRFLLAVITYYEKQNASLKQQIAELQETEHHGVVRL